MFTVYSRHAAQHASPAPPPPGGQAVGRLQLKALSARQQLEQVQHQARFELEKERLDHGKVLKAAEAASRHEVRRPFTLSLSTGLEENTVYFIVVTKKNTKKKSTHAHRHTHTDTQRHTHTHTQD